MEDDSGIPIDHAKTVVREQGVTMNASSLRVKFDGFNAEWPHA